MCGSAGKPLPRLSNRAARKLFLERHGLGRPPEGEDLAGLIERLGFVQIDSIATVERAHHMNLASRRRSYRPQQLDDLLERRALFEHWTHDASIIPMSFYPHWRLRFLRDAELLPARWRTWRRAGLEDRFDGVLARIREGGPVMAREFANSAATDGVTHPAGGTGIRRRRRWNSSGAPARSPSTGARGSRRSSTWLTA